MLYKIFKKIKRFAEKRFLRKQVKYSEKHYCKTCVFEEGVKIQNPNVVLGKGVTLNSNVIICGRGRVFIDDNAIIGYNTIIYSHFDSSVYIGKNTAIAANVYIVDTNHSTEKLDLSIDNPIAGADKSEPIFIGNNVWVCSGCILGKGTRLGDCSVVGANSFVNQEIPSEAIAVGNPAKVIKYRR